MATRFQELEVSGIEQGRFMEKLNAAFAEVSAKLIAHVTKESEKPPKAEAVLALTIKLVYENDFVRIITDIKKKLPEKKIVGVSTAHIEAGQDGQLTLWAPAGGSNSGDSRQSVLCGDNGEEL